MARRMKRFQMSVSESMYNELEKEKDARRLDNVQEVIRQILSDYLRHRNSKKQ